MRQFKSKKVEVEVNQPVEVKTVEVKTVEPVEQSNPNITKYIDQLNDLQRIAFDIAKTRLKTSFDIEKFRKDNRFSNIRSLGTIAALDLNLKNSDYLSSISLDLMKFFNDKGIVMRPLGATLYVLPPYCVSLEELESVYKAIDAAAEVFADKN